LTSSEEILLLAAAGESTFVIRDANGGSEERAPETVILSLEPDTMVTMGRMVIETVTPALDVK
jgi:hypothetical protein